eukprot:TRINITY_DN30877_c0_g1_i1.p1 TRINITY_DN30877_c0_g1~~TRINITY_DN30877_c0_g1_i1.p1  ORF type:complete len:679 (+),score=223.00 TRINITY_DN30877_c0_g1_i1:93-2129(+)
MSGFVPEEGDDVEVVAPLRGQRHNLQGHSGTVVEVVGTQCKVAFDPPIGAVFVPADSLRLAQGGEAWDPEGEEEANAQAAAAAAVQRQRERERERERERAREEEARRQAQRERAERRRAQEAPPPRREADHSAQHHRRPAALSFSSGRGVAFFALVGAGLMGALHAFRSPAEQKAPQLPVASLMQREIDRRAALAGKPGTPAPTTPTPPQPTPAPTRPPKTESPLLRTPVPLTPSPTRGSTPAPPPPSQTPAPTAALPLTPLPTLATPAPTSPPPTPSPTPAPTRPPSLSLVVLEQLADAFLRKRLSRLPPMDTASDGRHRAFTCVRLRVHRLAAAAEAGANGTTLGRCAAAVAELTARRGPTLLWAGDPTPDSFQQHAKDWAATVEADAAQAVPGGTAWCDGGGLRRAVDSPIPDGYTASDLCAIAEHQACRRAKAVLQLGGSAEERAALTGRGVGLADCAEVTAHADAVGEEQAKRLATAMTWARFPDAAKVRPRAGNRDYVCIRLLADRLAATANGTAGFDRCSDALVDLVNRPGNVYVYPRPLPRALSPDAREWATVATGAVLKAVGQVRNATVCSGDGRAWLERSVSAEAAAELNGTSQPMCQRAERDACRNARLVLRVGGAVDDEAFGGRGAAVRHYADCSAVIAAAAKRRRRQQRAPPKSRGKVGGALPPS